jgi:hypothetical protein
MLQTLGASCIQHDSPAESVRVVCVVGVVLAGLQEDAPVGLEEAVAMDCSDPYRVEARQQIAGWLNQLPLQLVVAYSQSFQCSEVQSTCQMWRGTLLRSPATRRFAAPPEISATAATAANAGPAALLPAVCERLL